MWSVPTFIKSHKVFVCLFVKIKAFWLIDKILGFVLQRLGRDSLLFYTLIYHQTIQVITYSYHLTHLKLMPFRLESVIFNVQYIMQ